jgi:hypothetical protein
MTGQCGPFCAPRAGLGLLRLSQSLRPAHVLATPLRSALAFDGAGTDKVALHVSKAAQNRHADMPKAR